MRRTWVAGVPVLVASMVLGLAACGGSQSADNSAGDQSAATGGEGGGISSSLDPCQLVTQQQVAAAVGVSVDAGKAPSQQSEGSRDCTYMTAYGDQGAGPHKIASVTVEVSGPNPALKSRFPTARSYFDFLRNEEYSDQAEDVSGIGDAAFFTAKGTWLWAIQGKTVLRLYATFGDEATVKPVLEQLMKEALART